MGRLQVQEKFSQHYRMSIDHLTAKIKTSTKRGASNEVCCKDVLQIAWPKAPRFLFAQVDQKSLTSGQALRGERLTPEHQRWCTAFRRSTRLCWFLSLPITNNIWAIQYLLILVARVSRGKQENSLFTSQGLQHRYPHS